MKKTVAADAKTDLPEICIDVRSGASLIVPHPPMALVEDLLEYEEITFAEDKEHMYREQRQVIEYWATDIKNRLTIPTGLVPRMAQGLAATGYIVHQTDHRNFSKGFEVDESAIAKVEDCDVQEMLETVRREPMGQIETRGLKDTAGRVAAICRMYPGARVLFPVATRNLARTLRQVLQKELNRNIPILSQQRLANPARYAVCTLARLNTLDLAGFDMLMLVDPLRSLGKVATRGMGAHGFDFKRVYSFVPVKSKLSDRSRLALAAVSGDLIHRQSEERLEVKVVWLRTPSCPAIDDCLGLTFKRQAYWRNRSRNDYVAAVARAFAAYDWDKLKKYGVTAPYTPEVCDDELRRPFVTVLVESTEHAHELQARLTDWSVINAVPDETTDACDESIPAGHIATLVAAKESRIRTDVLINATGGQSVPEVKGYPGKLWSDDDPDALLVDFKDEFNERALSQANQRRRQYSNAGWNTYASQPPANAAVDA